MSDVLSDKLEECCNQLVEHGESVLILVSVPTDDGVLLYHRYAGAWHSALGMMEHFKAMKLSEKIKDAIQDE